MTHRVVVQPRAQAEAAETVRWIGGRSPQAADRWLAGLQKALATLAERPERYPIAEDISEQVGAPIRQLLYGRRPGVYRVLYAIEGGFVSVLSIRHAARGPLELGPPHG